jgi:hypothetical protein
MILCGIVLTSTERSISRVSLAILVLVKTLCILIDTKSRLVTVRGRESGRERGCDLYNLAHVLKRPLRSLSWTEYSRWLETDETVNLGELGIMPLERASSLQLYRLCVLQLGSSIWRQQGYHQSDRV